MHVEDAVREIANELHVVDTLVAKVARIVVEPEAAMAVHGLDGPRCGSDVKGDFGRMHLQSKVDIDRIELIEDRLPARREIIKSLLVVLLAGRRERVYGMPDTGTGESVDHRPPRTGRLVRHVGGPGIDELPAGPGGIDHLPGRALAHPFRVTVTPDHGRKNGLVTLIDIVTDRLTHQVIRNGITDHAMLLEKLPASLDVAVLIERFLDVEMITPAGEFDSVVAHVLYLGQEVGKRKIGPLAGEECYWSCHLSVWLRIAFSH